MIILVICYSRINLLNRLSDETLGRYFNFEKNGYDAVMAVYFKPGIGEWLWENGISLEQYLENLAWEENIDISGLTGKAKCVFEKLKDLTLFKETIGKFENNNSYDLIFSYSGIWRIKCEKGLTIS